MLNCFKTPILAEKSIFCLKTRNSNELILYLVLNKLHITRVNIPMYFGVLGLVTWVICTSPTSHNHTVLVGHLIGLIEFLSTSFCADRFLFFVLFITRRVYVPLASVRASAMVRAVQTERSTQETWTL